VYLPEENAEAEEQIATETEITKIESNSLQLHPPQESTANLLHRTPIWQGKIKDIYLQPSFSRAKRIIELPNHWRLETTDSKESKALETYINQNLSIYRRILSYIEQEKTGILTLSAIAVFFIGIVYFILLPVTTQAIVALIPEHLETMMGEGVLKSMESGEYFSKSEITTEKQQQLINGYQSTCKHQPCPPYQILFRKSNEAIGANAFALPGGIIVVTDALVKLSEQPEDVWAILAHEMGHVQAKHSLRHIVRNATLSAIFMLVTGDITSIGYALTLSFLNLQHSRTLETEADAYAKEHLEKNCIPLTHFATMLKKISSQRGHDANASFLSTHPNTEERIQLFLAPSATKKC
jgi:Zn-dependent protease with chaperone function